ncbi:MAG: hypothetical protein ACH254_13190, partial [Candidatus Thiodiazotropha endolucinida]
MNKVSASGDAVTDDAVTDDVGSGGFYITKRKRRLKGQQLEWFNQFWETFNFKKGRAEAADAWLNLKITGEQVPG